MEILKFIIFAAILLTGLFFLCLAVFGTFKYEKTSERMHSAALGDSIGVFLMILAYIIWKGAHVASLKALILLGIMWLAGSVSCHLVAKLYRRLRK